MPVNEYQLWLGRQRQVWFIPLAYVRGVFTTRRYTNPRLPLPMVWHSG